MELSSQEHRKLQRALQGDLEIPRELAARLEEHLSECRACQRLLKSSAQVREKIRRDFLASEHLSQEQLFFLLTAESSRMAASAADRRMLQEQRAHLAKCSLCRKREQHARKELARCEKVVFETTQEFQRPERQHTTAAAEIQSRRSFPSFFAKTAAITAFLSAASLIVFFLNVAYQPAGYKYLNPDVDSYQSCFIRYLGDLPPASAASTPQERQKLAEAENALYDGHARRALDVLAGIDARLLQNEELLRFRLYELMATLKDAHAGFLGLFPSFDTARVGAALQKMEQALPSLRLRVEARDSRYLGPAYYYAAKANLILSRVRPAQSHLTDCLALPPHRRKQEAAALQAELARF